MTQGVSVTIRTSVPEYNAVAWVVDEPPRDGKVTLVAQVQNMEKKISVGVDKVWPATLAVQTREAMDCETCHIIGEWRLGSSRPCTLCLELTTVVPALTCI